MQKTKKHVGIPKRTLIGILCLLLAAILSFAVLPLVVSLAEKTVSMVRVVRPVEKGSVLTEQDVEVVKIAPSAVPKQALTALADVVGQTTRVPLYAGDCLMKDKLGTTVSMAEILTDIPLEQKLISVSISSLATGVSDKIDPGDIIGIMVYDRAEGESLVPDELRYVRVVALTTTDGLDKANGETRSVTATLLVNEEQAKLLVAFEQTGKIHMVLECHHDEDKAAKYLAEQDFYFGKKG